MKIETIGEDETNYIKWLFNVLKNSERNLLKIRGDLNND